jgi:hypothetical protein
LDLEIDFGFPTVFRVYLLLIKRPLTTEEIETTSLEQNLEIPYWRLEELKRRRSWQETILSES